VIRAWLERARAERVAARAARGERAWRRDLHEHPDERDAFRLAQIAGLRESNAALRAEVAQLRYALAQAVQHAGLERYLQAGVEQARRLAEEPTAVVSTDQLRRARPAAPTEQYGRPR